MFSQGKIKDQFYLKNKASKFYKRNIAHIEWYNSDLTNQSNEYYVKNNIPFFFWDSFSYKKQSILAVIRFFIFKLKIIQKLYKYSILIEVLTSTYQIYNSKEKIKNNFSKLKYVLVGYDLLFHNEISLAFKHLKIETISIQDRILIPSWSHIMCFDYYFTLGPESKKILMKRMNNTVKYLKKIQILKINFPLKKKKYINKNKIKCLIIDYHSLDEKKWYENGRIIHNWKSNFDFYYTILSLSNKYKNIFFYIKSKNYSWLKNSNFKNLVKNLKKQKNIKILNNKKKWTPDRSINFTDFAIAKYSSLSDQMLYLNKPVIVHNYEKFPGLIFNFSNKLLVKNSTELENKINAIMRNYNNYNKSLKMVRKNLFYFKIKNNSLINLLTSLDKKL